MRLLWRILTVPAGNATGWLRLNLSIDAPHSVAVINAPETSIAQSNSGGKKALKNIPTQGTIGKITIFGSDGVVILK